MYSDIETSESKNVNEKFSAFKNLVHSPKYRIGKQFLSALLFLAIAGSSLFFANEITKPTQKIEKSKAGTSVSVPWTYPRPVKVLIMRYFNPASQPNYKDPVIAQQITDNLQANLIDASRYHNNPSLTSAIKTQVVGQYDFGAMPNVNNDWQATYNSILSTQVDGTQTVCDKVNALAVDEVWFMGDPTIAGTVSGPEFTISSKYIQAVSAPTDYDRSILPKTPFCGGQRSLMMFFMDLSRPGPSVHAFGHYMESLLGSLQSFDLFYKGYMGVTYDNIGGGEVIPGVDLTEHCGSIHIPPNVPVVTSTNPYSYLYQRPNYDYSTVVSSSCANWKPDGSGQKTAVSNSTWVNNPTTLPGDPEFKFHMWWMQNIPNINNGLTYLGFTLPNWWDFLSDTDNTVAWYLNSPYFMNPQIFATAFANPTTACTGTSGISSTCTTGTSTLGAMTENDSVLGTSTYGDIAIVSALYSASQSNSTNSVKSVTYCGDSMTRIGTAPGSHVGFKSELWYKTLPKTGSCSVIATFNTDPGQRIVTATTFNNIDTVNPVANFTSSVYDSPTMGTPGKITMSLAGPKDSLLLCAYDMYSEQTNPPSPNFATPVSPTLGLWKFEKENMNGVAANIWGGLGAGTQRVSDNQMVTLNWNTVKTMPWSAFCANLNVKPFVIPGPTTTAVPTVTPTKTPVPTVTPTKTPSPTTVPTNTPVSTTQPTSYFLVPKSQMTATVSSQHVGYEATKAFDDNTTTIWHSEWSPYAALPQSISFDLHGTYKVGKIGYLPRQDGGVNGIITGYKVLVSMDGVTVTTAATGVWADNTSLKSIEFTPVNAKYVALMVTSGHGNYASASELAVWYTSVSTTPSPTIVPTVVPTATPASYPHITMSATSEHVGFEANKATDFDFSTIWHSDWNPYSPLPQTMILNLNGLYTISGIAYTPRQDGATYGIVTSYKVSVSTNGVNYTLVKSGTWAADITGKAALFTKVATRYVKFEMLSGTSGYASASEIGVNLQ